MVAQIRGWIEIIDAYDHEEDCPLANISVEAAIDIAASIGPESFKDGMKFSSPNYGGDVIFIAANRNHLSQMAWYFRWIMAISEISKESQAVISIVDSDPVGGDSLGCGFEVKGGEYWVCSLSGGEICWHKNLFNMSLT